MSSVFGPPPLASATDADWTEPATRDFIDAQLRWLKGYQRIYAGRVSWFYREYRSRVDKTLGARTFGMTAFGPNSAQHRIMEMTLQDFKKTIGTLRWYESWHEQEDGTAEIPCVTREEVQSSLKDYLHCFWEPDGVPEAYCLLEAITGLGRKSGRLLSAHAFHMAFSAYYASAFSS